jgi:hypothetical protein
MNLDWVIAFFDVIILFDHCYSVFLRHVFLRHYEFYE